MTLVHDPLAVELARMNIVDVDEPVELLVELIVLVLQHAGEILDEYNPSAAPLRSAGAIASMSPRRSTSSSVFRGPWIWPGCRSRPTALRRRPRIGLRCPAGSCAIGNEVLGCRAGRDAGVHLAAGALDVVALRFLVGAVAPGIVGEMMVHRLPRFSTPHGAPAAAIHRCRCRCGSCSACPSTRSLRSLRRSRNRCVLSSVTIGIAEQHDAGMHRSDDERGIAALDQRAQLAGAGRRVGLGVLGHEFDLSAGNATALVDHFDCGLGRLVVPDSPRTRRRR